MAYKLREGTLYMIVKIEQKSWRMYNLADMLLERVLVSKDIWCKGNNVKHLTTCSIAQESYAIRFYVGYIENELHMIHS